MYGCHPTLDPQPQPSVNLLLLIIIGIVLLAGGVVAFLILAECWAAACIQQDRDRNRDYHSMEELP